MTESLTTSVVTASSETLNRALDSSPLLAWQSLGSREDDYHVSIPVYEGPLDLLLHLIRKDQINIYDIPIAHICESYFRELQRMKQPDVNVAGEFMVMAATLMHMKSVLILPREGEGLGGEEDPRAPLVAQLLEYERFKRAAVQLDLKPWLYRDHFPRPAGVGADIPVESLMDAPIEPVDAFQLLLCLKIATDRTHKKPIEIRTDPTSIREKVFVVGELLESQESVEFTQILPSPPVIQDIIVGFLAVLELARLKFVEIIQTTNFGPIQIRAVRSIRDLNVALLDQF